MDETAQQKFTLCTCRVSDIVHVLQHRHDSIFVIFISCWYRKNFLAICTFCFVFKELNPLSKLPLLSTRGYLCRYCEFAATLTHLCCATRTEVRSLLKFQEACHVVHCYDIDVEIITTSSFFLSVIKYYFNL